MKKKKVITLLWFQTSENNIIYKISIIIQILTYSKLSEVKIKVLTKLKLDMLKHIYACLYSRPSHITVSIVPDLCHLAQPGRCQFTLILQYFLFPPK